MTPSHTTRKGSQRYRYYTCSGAQKRGWQTCPSKSIPAAQIEQLVVEQIQQLGRDPQVLHDVLAQVRQQDDARLAEMEAERAAPGARPACVGRAKHAGCWPRSARASPTAGWCRVWRSCKSASARSSSASRACGRRWRRCSKSVWTRRRRRGRWPVWTRPGTTMTPDEQGRIVGLLVSRVDYDGAQGKVAITFHPLGLKTLAGDRLGRNSEEQSA